MTDRVAGKTTDAQLARIFQQAIRATTGEIPPSQEEIAGALEASRGAARARPERNRAPASLARSRAVERRRDAAGEPLGPELPTDERRGLAIVRRPRSARGTPADRGPSAKRRRFLEGIALRAPRLRLLDWTRRIATRARQIGASPIEAARAVAELPRVYAIRVRRAALGIERRGTDYTAARSWRSIYARRCVAYAWAIYRASVETRRRGFGRVAVGISQGMIAALITNPQTLRPYSRAGVAAPMSGQRGDGCGPLVALERAGAWYAEQPPAEITPIELVGPSGHAVQHYWITDRSCSPLLIELEELIGAVAPHDPPPVAFSRYAAPSTAPPQ